jgi:hypothetical protein
MYERAMGEDFERLPAAVRRFHRLAGTRQLQGWVETDAPVSILAKLVALCLGSPLEARSGPMRFELDAQPASETWTRHFPAQRMTSRLALEGRQVVERLGPARMTFELRESGGRLEMRLRRFHFLGVPCPAWLMPRVVAEETGGDERLHFKVQAALPLVGVVAAYRGHLEIPDEAPP